MVEVGGSSPSMSTSIVRAAARVLQTHAAALFLSFLQRLAEQERTPRFDLTLLDASRSAPFADLLVERHRHAIAVAKRNHAIHQAVKLGRPALLHITLHTRL